VRLAASSEFAGPLSLPNVLLQPLHCPGKIAQAYDALEKKDGRFS